MTSQNKIYFHNRFLSLVDSIKIFLSPYSTCHSSLVCEKKSHTVWFISRGIIYIIIGKLCYFLKFCSFLIVLNLLHDFENIGMNRSYFRIIKSQS
jgi:hypothetical protein